MKINLVNPPRTFLDRAEIAPPLGLLRLASAGLSAGANVSITDFNLLFHTDPRLSNTLQFYSVASEYLLNENADVYCFTSMAIDTHVAIHLARLLKEKRPDVIIVVGGTHFGAIAESVIEKFPWIDFVVIGEGENILKQFSKLLLGNKRHTIITGSPFTLSTREDLPFDLIDLNLYFKINNNRSLDFESGRGCRFKCAFCYSPGHYKGFRNFSEDKTIAELVNARQLGFRNVFFVEDNFLNDSTRTANLCKEIEQSRLGLTWHCYATFPQLSSEIIPVLATAGCTAVFTGIDAVGYESRRAYRKAFVREASTLCERINECIKNGIIPTCAFLLSPPSHRGGCDLEETLFFALSARNAGANVRLNTLTLYNQTTSSSDAIESPMHDEFKVRLMLDVPEIVESNPYAITYPELFPFHSRYVGQEEWHDFILLVHCLYTLFESYPQTLQRLWDTQDISPIHIARAILDNTEPLLNISKAVRRDAQLLATIQVLEKLTFRNLQLQRVLEKESEFILAI